MAVVNSPTPLRPMLRAALEQRPPSSLPPELGLPAGVLVPVIDGIEPCVMFTVRTADLSRHPGEISFPGGLVHEGDTDLEATALRETEEELGVAASVIDVVGVLDPLPTFVSSIVIVPFVGILERRPELSPNPAEIAEVLEFPVARLDEAEAEVEWTRDGRTWQGFVYEMEGKTIWGATGRILHQLIEILRRAPEEATWTSSGR